MWRAKDVEWVTFLTTRFVDDITNHLKIYRKAKQALDKAAKNEGIYFAFYILLLDFNINRKSDLNLAANFVLKSS